MRALLPFVAATLLASAPATVHAGDITYAVFVDGRPVDRHSNSALQHNGTLYIDIVRAVRTFDGLLTYRGAALVVTLGGRVLECTVGELSAHIDGSSTQLPAAPFTSGGDTYVPLDTIAALTGADLTIDPRRRQAHLNLPPH